MAASTTASPNKKHRKAVPDVVAFAKATRGTRPPASTSDEAKPDEHLLTLEDDEPAATALDALAIPLDDIVRSPHNTRKTFDELSIEALAESMRQVGQTTMCEVLPMFGGKYELVDGERRYRAAKVAGLKTLRCAVRAPSGPGSLEVDLVRFEANRNREDLNPIDEALAFERFLKPTEEGGHGLSQAELAMRVGVSPSQISNRVRLLRLPERARGLVISGEMPVEDARELAAFCDLPKVVAAIEKSKLRTWSGYDVFDLLEQHFVNVEGLSEDVRKKHADALQVRVLTRGKNWTVHFATGDRPLAMRLLQEKRAAEEARWAKQSQRGAAKKKGEKVDPLLAAKRKAEILNKRLWRYTVQWYLDRLPDACKSIDVGLLWRWALFLAGRSDQAFQRAGDLGEALGSDDTLGATTLKALSKLDETTMQVILRELLTSWVCVDITRFSESFKPAEIVEMGRQAGLSMERDWRLDDMFVGLFDAEGLGDLWVELGLVNETKSSIPRGAKRGFAVDQFVAAIAKNPEKKRPFPKCLKSVTPVSLT